MMRFEVLDESGKVIAAGRDLAEIRRELGVRAQADLAKLVGSPWYRDGVTSWDFGDIPQRVEIHKHGMTLHAYPALVDQGETAGLRLFESAETAAAAHRAGVRRLFILQLGPDVKNLERHVRNLEEASVLYTMVAPPAEAGSPGGLVDDILMAGADRALYGLGGEVRTRDEFVQHAQTGWRTLLLAANEIAQIVLDALARICRGDEVDGSGLMRRRGGMRMWTFAARFSAACARVCDFNAFSIGFLASAPVRAGHSRADRESCGIRATTAIWPGSCRSGRCFSNIWNGALDHERAGIVDPELESYRWMLEELRVSVVRAGTGKHQCPFPCSGWIDDGPGR